MSSSNVVPAQLSVPEISNARRIYWTVRRDVWEYRFIYLAPMAAGVIAIVAFVIRLIRPTSFAATEPVHSATVLDQPYTFAAILVLGTAMLVSIFYSIDAMHAERRDRSILFWKSLPVSDLTTVLAKTIVALGVIPLAAFVLTIATQFIILLLGSIGMLIGGQGAGSLWTPTVLLRPPLMLLYHIVTVHIFWYAPFYAWFLLASAWARRAPLLWATVPPLAIVAVEKIAFNTSYFGTMLINRFSGGPEAMTMRGTMPTDSMTHLTPLHFLASPGLWFGLGLSAAFLYAAAYIRRHRGPV